jgi:hypothetical protein
LASYHPGRNKFGWKVASKEWAAYLHKSVDSGKLTKDEALHMAGADEERQDSLHVFVVPRLLKPEWFHLLYKTADIVFDVPVGSECWPTNMYEPLTLGIAFPYLRVPPWQLGVTCNVSIGSVVQDWSAE